MCGCLAWAVARAFRNRAGVVSAVCLELVMDLGAERYRALTDEYALDTYADRRLAWGALRRACKRLGCCRVER